VKGPRAFRSWKGKRDSRKGGSRKGKGLGMATEHKKLIKFGSREGVRVGSKGRGIQKKKKDK